MNMNKVDEIVDRWTSTFANIEADITLGKNLSEHLEVVNSCIEALNDKIDRTTDNPYFLNNLESICYQVYRLQNRIIKLIKEKG